MLSQAGEEQCFHGDRRELGLYDSPASAFSVGLGRRIILSIFLISGMITVDSATLNAARRLRVLFSAAFTKKFRLSNIRKELSNHQAMLRIILPKRKT